MNSQTLTTEPLLEADFFERRLLALDNEPCLVYVLRKNETIITAQDESIIIAMPLAREAGDNGSQ